jgi:uncharacterized protein YndB with AHSA1/START domain
MLTNIALVLLVFLVALMAFVATRPAEFRLVRSRTLAAAPELVYAFVNDFHKWPAWSPWEKLDPTMKREISGPSSGTGATYYWSGNSKAGEGRMTITDSRVPQSITIRLEFIKPWTATNTTQFEFAPKGSGTEVVWSMSGHNNFMAKAFSVFMNMEKMVGPDFEKGLASLDMATAAAKPSATLGA